MSKRLLAAGIVRDLEFDSMERLELYLYQLERRCIEHKVIETFERADGFVISRILMQFGGVPLIELFH